MKIIAQVNTGRFLVEAGELELLNIAEADRLALQVGTEIVLPPSWAASRFIRSRRRDVERLAAELRDLATAIETANKSLAHPTVEVQP
jgi:hypothetical protein